MSDKNEISSLLNEMGIPNGDYWAEKEVTESNRAILSMLRFLRPFQKTLDSYLYNYDEWIENINKCNDDVLKAEIKEMIEAGVSNETIGKFAYWASRTAINQVLYRLDDPAGADYDLENEGEDLPRWILKEVVGDKETGRYIHGMHGIFPFTNA